MSINNQAAREIGMKLWSLCHVLRDDGVTFHQYLNELTYLLFLKMMKETSQEERLKIWKRPKRGEPIVEQIGIRWDDLVNASTVERLDLYKEMLLDYELHGRGPVRDIYFDASTLISKPATLEKIVVEIDAIDWYSVQRDDLGNLYEELLERNATEKKGGAGQYFTPRELIDCIVRVMQPQLNDIIQDPAAGTGGFLIAANNYLRDMNDLTALDVDGQNRYRYETFFGMELVKDTHRLALMNMLLHGIEGGIVSGDTLSDDNRKLPKATLIFSNPPFGTKKGGGAPDRRDLIFPTNNKQFAFLQHIYQSLLPGGRAAVVLPDNVLFESNIGSEIRRDLMEKCNLHTILRLPTGIFYAQAVKTNVLFFTKAKEESENTKEVWIYDMRSNMPQFGKRNALTSEYFRTSVGPSSKNAGDKFEDVFGSDPWGGLEALSKRVEAGQNSRWRRFTREEVRQRGDNLAINWLSDDNIEEPKTDLNDPATVARYLLHEFESAMAELRTVINELGEDPDLPLDDLLLSDPEQDTKHNTL